MEDLAEPAPDRPPACVRTADFVLRAISESDWPVEAELSRDAEVVRWTFYPEDMDERAARERIRHYQTRAAEGATRRFVILDEHGIPLGTCGIGRLQQEVPELFYTLLPHGRGRGAATQAVRSLAQWALGGRDAVALVTVEGNQPSEDVARRVGFVPVEQFHDDHRGRQATLTRWLLRRQAAVVSDTGR